MKFTKSFLESLLRQVQVLFSFLLRLLESLPKGVPKMFKAIEKFIGFAQPIAPGRAWKKGIDDDTLKLHITSPRVRTSLGIVLCLFRYTLFSLQFLRVLLVH